MGEARIGALVEVGVAVAASISTAVMVGVSIGAGVGRQDRVASTRTNVAHTNSIRRPIQPPKSIFSFSVHRPLGIASPWVLSPVVSLWSVGDGSERPERNEVESKDARGGFFDCISLRSIPLRRPPLACYVQQHSRRTPPSQKTTRNHPSTGSG